MSLLESVKCCSLGNEHIVECPISLVCGHLVCKFCLQDQEQVFCGVCNEIRKVVLNSNEHNKVQELIRAHLNELYNIIEVKFQDLIEKFNGN
jgi:hypothetical protein